MSNTFLIADTHFGHQGVCNFKNNFGGKLRPWTNPQDMDKDLVEYWNDTVSPKDKVYVLGDVVMPRKSLATVGLLHGDKILVKGNHDIYQLNDYSKYFRDIRGCAVIDGFLLTHIPVHPGQKARFTGNIHGHLHSERIWGDDWYFCVSVEQTNYRPISWEDVMAKFKQQNALGSMANEFSEYQ